MINVLLIGDIVGSPGRAILKQALPKILRKRSIDYCIANAENLAGGNGVTRELAEELLSLGVNCLTSGNHIWDKREIMPIMDVFPQLLRPANYPVGQPGKGHHIGKSRTGVKVATLNLSGRVFMNGAIDDPFTIGKKIAEELRKETPVILVDMHAETTSEKAAMGFFMDGLASVVVGTHTHVPTCDHRILPKGTAYCTDIGMTGPYDSVIGVEKDIIIKRFVDGLPAKFETAKGDPAFRRGGGGDRRGHRPRVVDRPDVPDGIGSSFALGRPRRPRLRDDDTPHSAPAAATPGPGPASAGASPVDACSSPPPPRRKAPPLRSHRAAGRPPPATPISITELTGEARPASSRPASPRSA